MTFTALAVLFAVLVVTTAGLALYRKLISMREDDCIHIGEGEERLIPQQLEVAHKLAVLDRWGEILTVVTAGYGLVVGVLYLYQRFQAY
jgi:hypothetical protein